MCVEGGGSLFSCAASHHVEGRRLLAAAETFAADDVSPLPIAGAAAAAPSPTTTEMTRRATGGPSTEPAAPFAIGPLGF